MNGEIDRTRILLVEDDPDEARRVHACAAAAGRVEVVRVGLVMDALAELDAAAFDLVLLDLSLPDGRGIGSFIRIHAAAPDTPVLVLAERNDEVSALKAVHAGAVDYLYKDQLTDVLLGRAIRYALDRRHTDAALRSASRENDRLAAAISNLTTGVVITDPHAEDDPIIFANAGFLAMTGYAAEEVLGRNPRFLQGPDTDPVAVAELRQAIRARRPCEIVLRNYRKDGTPFWNELAISPVWDEDGELIHFVGLQTDVTARIDAEEELAARNRELATLQRIAEFSLAADSPDRVFDAITAEIAQATGMPIVAIELYDEAARRMVYRAAHGIPLPDDGRPLGVPLDRALSGRVVRTREPVFASRLGERPELRNEILDALGVRSCACVPMVADERVIGTLTLAHREEVRFDDRFPRFAASLASFVASLVERTRAEEALAAEGERLAVTLRSIAEGVVTTDTRGRITLMNRVAEQLSGWTQADALGRPLPEVFPLVDERTREARDPVRRIFDEEGTPGPVTGQDVLVTGDGAERILAESVAPLLDQAGTIVGAVLVFRDITRERDIEEELLKARKLESLGVLAGGIAHDYNNLLTGILGHLSLLRSDPESDEFRAALAEAENAARRARDLTRRLLTFSAGGAPIRRRAAIGGLVEDAVRAVLQDSGIDTRVSVPRDLHPVEIDEGQVGQAIGNILLNARQAMPDGGTVRITCRNVGIRPGRDHERPLPPLPAGDYVRISIRDDGPGIASEHLPRIFDPYFTTRPDHSGLGLAAAYSIVRKHGGHITVDSAPGRGAAFDIYLPAVIEAAPPTVEPARPAAAGPHRVLVMDDDEVVLAVVRRMLTRLGYEVETATDGEAAIERYRRAMQEGSPFDVVLMDLTVPDGMGGRDAVRKLLELDPEARAIVSSGYSNDPVMAEFRKHGFRGVIAKPYDLQQLRRTMEEVIAGAPA